MNSNSENPGVGRHFQELVCSALTQVYHHTFEIEVNIEIGFPKKSHHFDIANPEHTFVCECKCYTWTDTGNIPSAKMGFINEAAFYLSFLPDTTEKAIVMLRSVHPKRKESLAEYYYRTNKHLLGKIKMYEYDMASGSINQIS